MVWMSPQSAKIETRRGRWSDLNRERRGVMKKANGSLLRQEYCCVDVEREQDRQGSEKRWGEGWE